MDVALVIFFVEKSPAVGKVRQAEDRPMAGKVDFRQAWYHNT